MSVRRKVLLIEPTAEGHHFALYLRHVLRKLIDEGCDISLLTTGAAIRHASFGLLADELRDVAVHQLPDLPAAARPRPLSLLDQMLVHPSSGVRVDRHAAAVRCGLHPDR
jgi:hypothetical protein